MSALRQVAALVAKDLLIEWRTRDLFSTTLVLGFTSILLFNFAVDFARVPFGVVGPPVLWMAFLFTAITGLSRSFALERENRCLEGILLSPIDRGILYAGKLVVNFLVLSALQGFLVALAFVLLDQGEIASTLGAQRWALLAAVIGAGVLGFAAVGTLFALMAQRTRRGDLLLPVLQSILGLPVLVLAVVATRRLLDVQAPVSDIVAPLRLMIVFDVLFVAVSLVVFDAVVEE